MGPVYIPMKTVIKHNYLLLTRTLDPSNDLLGKLRSVDAVQEHIYEIIAEITKNEQNSKLLDILLQVPDEVEQRVANDLVDVLRWCGQDHVANLLRPVTGKLPMSDERYDLLSKKRSDICQFLEPRDGLLDLLVRNGVFTEPHRSLILSRVKIVEMAQKTLDTLLRRPDCDFDKFVSALHENEQSHVAYLLTAVGKLPMSEDRRDKFRTHTEVLCKYIDTENGLLNKLYSAKVLSYFDAHRIRSQTGYNDMARELVEVITRKSDDAFGTFIEALNSTQQRHVSYILTGEGDDPPLGEVLRNKLTENRTYLVKTIDSKHSGLITTLISKGVFSEYDQQRVEGRQPNTDIDRSEIVLDLMARKSQSSFDKLIMALKETGQEHVAVELVGVEVVANIIARTRPASDLTEAEMCMHIGDALEGSQPEVRRLNETLKANGISISGVRNGSILMIFQCEDVNAVANLKKLFFSGELKLLLSDVLCTQASGPDFESVCVDIRDSEFEDCERNFRKMKLMTPERREALIAAEEWLVNEVTVSGELVDKLLLSGRRKQAVVRAATHEQQVKTLLDIVSRQPDSAFSRLLLAFSDIRRYDAALHIATVYRNTESYGFVDSRSNTTSNVSQTSVDDEKIDEEMSVTTSALGVRYSSVTAEFFHVQPSSSRQNTKPSVTSSKSAVMATQHVGAAKTSSGAGNDFRSHHTNPFRRFMKDVQLTPSIFVGRSVRSREDPTHVYEQLGSSANNEYERLWTGLFVESDTVAVTTGKPG